MASKARMSFGRNAEDVRRLLQIHQTIGGMRVGRRNRLEVLNKSAIVLITAIWEAYCEDIAAEAMEHIVKNVNDATRLPKELRKQIAADIRSDRNEGAVWDLAGDGWKTRVSARLATLTEERNRRLNSPRSENIDLLFKRSIGLDSVSGRWRWKGMSPTRARKKLDEYVRLRGSIAHRGRGSATCRKAQVDDYFRHVKRLVAKTGGGVNLLVRSVTGSGLW